MSKIMMVKLNGWFFIIDALLFKRYTDICIKVGNSIEKILDWEPIYIKKLLETKIRSYSDEATNFHSKKISEEGLQSYFLGGIMNRFCP